MKNFVIIAIVFSFLGCSQSQRKEIAMQDDSYEVYKTDDEWKSVLSPDTYNVLRKKGTERAHSSSLNNNYKKGFYLCSGCDTPLYDSNRKYDSGTGWPSFDRAINGAVSTSLEHQFGQAITEVHCATCGGHLGHIFKDGPKETTGERHCINGVALKFVDMENYKDQNKPKEYKVKKSEEEWRNQLGDKRYNILRKAGTEYPHTGEYTMNFEKGKYTCGACGAPLFHSDSKFKSSCGWPSFDESIPGAIKYKRDTSHGMIRTETLCANCGSHLGHIFEDGPTATGQRYCINSLSMDFEKE